MSYEYKNEIRQMVAYSYMNIDTREGMKRFGELDEVYRKAQAFDTLLHTYERYRHSHENDLKLLLGMKAIELLEADE